MKSISRSTGRSAVAAAAYRAGVCLINERDGLPHDFTRKDGVVHTEIVLPQGVSAEWAKDRSALWNAAERAEKRNDARVAREFEVALPHELTAQQRLGAVREFASELANRYGAAVDFAIHEPHGASDVRNHHAHIMMTTRHVLAEGLGEKTHFERESRWLIANGLPTANIQLRDCRQRWECIANRRLAMAGLELRIDHRSHMDRGLEIEPTEHVGVHATQMERRGSGVARTRLDAEAAERNADLIREKPEQVLEVITGEKSVFGRRDVALTLHRYLNDDPQIFQNVLATVMASPALVTLQAGGVDPVTGEAVLTRYSTREMIALEAGMIRSAQKMHVAQSHGVSLRHAERAMARQDAAIRRSSGDRSAGLSKEQRAAIAHVIGPERIAAVVGFAGAGKSTMLAAAREAWEAHGYTVHGAALSGKAAEGLEESSGIPSRTLASWSRSWENDRGILNRGDVFVIDEAGMVGSRELARFVGEAGARGAKIVLVGDHEQLQAIGAGAPFRAITEAIGHAELSDIRRQRVDWQREASVAFATHRTAEGLAAYRDRGDIRFSESGETARAQIVDDYLADRAARPDGSRVAMAHRRADVRAINNAIRAALQERGELAKSEVAQSELASSGSGTSEAARGNAPAVSEHTGALSFQTNDGKREFAPGDRIVFLENNRDLGVKNGMLGTVESVQPGRIVARLDGKDSDSVSIRMGDYQAIDHGYATTIHKNQGATVDRAYVLASATMDRHLTYVAMTRHRDSVQLHAAQDAFTGKGDGQRGLSGRLLAHGPAPFEHQHGNRPSYFVTLENDKGEQHTTWGVDLGRAMKDAAPEAGDRIGLQHMGASPVTLPDGRQAHRNTWQVQEAGELAWGQLENRLSRSGVKETTLDYTGDFAARRGIAERLGVSSEIELRAGRREPEKPGRAEHSQQMDPHAPQQAERRQRSMFDGLRLNTAPAPSQERRGASQQAERQHGAGGDGVKPASILSPATKRLLAEQQLRMASMRKTLAEYQARNGERGVEVPRTGRASMTLEERLAEHARGRSPLEIAVNRYARACQSIEAHRRDGLPVLEMQQQEMDAAGRQLDQARAGAKDLICSAIQHDPATMRAITELSGRERVARIIAGMERERAALSDPNVRAERFVNCWQELDGRRQQLSGWRQDAARAGVESQMGDLARKLERDPLAQSIVRDSFRAAGIQHEWRRWQGVAQQLQDKRQDEKTRVQRPSRDFGMDM